jgi:hypothetical protein
MMMLYRTLDGPDDQVVGETVLEALQKARSEEDERWEVDELRTEADMLYTAAGVRGWREFVRGAAYVSVREDDDAVVVGITRNAGSRDGFVSTGDELRVERPVSAAELGAAVLRGIAQSGPSRDSPT